jgi:SAM-dependent methyltransferase
MTGFLIINDRKLTNKKVFLAKKKLEDLSADYWNNRYLTNNFGWDVGYPSTPLSEYFKQLTDKNLSILIPGAGNSYEAQLLFELGFTNVYVLDFAEKPLEDFKLRVPDFPESQLIQTDFFNYTGHFDLIIEQTFFCALHPELRGAYTEHMYRLLKPQGEFVGLLFNDPLNTDKPPFGGSEMEYRKLFSKLFNIIIMAPCYNSIKPRSGKELFVIMQPKAELLG